MKILKVNHTFDKKNWVKNKLNTFRGGGGLNRVEIWIFRVKMLKVNHTFFENWIKIWVKIVLGGSIRVKFWL